MKTTDFIPDFGLEEQLGIERLGQVFWNQNAAQLYEHALRRHEGALSVEGALVVSTGQHTGRSPRDKYLVDEPTTTQDIWWGKANVKIPAKHFEALYSKIKQSLREKTLFVQDLYACADERYRYKVRIVTEQAWHSLFARNMFIPQPLDPQSFRTFVPDLTVLQCPSLMADPQDDTTRSGTFVILNFAKKMVIIGGTSYGGEIKKSIFTALNYLLPKRGVLSMHCSANISKQDKSDVAIFFGLSGTGKTTLSTDPKRLLIGDDEHGWSDEGVFNFEGGCYAKVICLSKDSEPEIYACTEKFGTILENVVYARATRVLDLNDAVFTENTRASYPITHLENIVPEGKAGQPRNVFMLTCDAFGVLPPISRLTPEQAMYHFISGYTAKVAGTEKGVTEPQATFSTCFGAPFMVWHPSKYATMLAERLEKYKADCWLVNTGWTGGPFGVGHRMSIKHTRALLNAALDGKLKSVEFYEDPIFGIQVPRQAPGVPEEILNPKNTWSDPEAYDAQAKKLAGLFQENFEKFKDKTPEKVHKAGPR